MKSEEMIFEFVSDFAVSDCITKESLSRYGTLPYKVKSGLFLLCVRGTVKLSINLTSYTIQSNDFVTLVPNTFIQFDNGKWHMIDVINIRITGPVIVQ